MPNYISKSTSGQLSGPQLVKSKTKEASVRRPGRPHEVPSTITKPMRDEIAGAVSMGRSVPQTSKEYNAERCVVIELWMRDEIRRLRNEIAGLRDMLGRRAA